MQNSCLMQFEKLKCTTSATKRRHKCWYMNINYYWSTLVHFLQSAWRAWKLRKLRIIILYCSTWRARDHSSTLRELNCTTEEYSDNNLRLFFLLYANPSSINYWRKKNWRKLAFLLPAYFCFSTFQPKRSVLLFDKSRCTSLLNKYPTSHPY